MNIDNIRKKSIELDETIRHTIYELCQQERQIRRGSHQELIARLCSINHVLAQIAELNINSSGAFAKGRWCEVRQIWSHILSVCANQNFECFDELAHGHLTPSNNPTLHQVEILSRYDGRQFDRYLDSGINSRIGMGQYLQYWMRVQLYITFSLVKKGVPGDCYQAVVRGRDIERSSADTIEGIKVLANCFGSTDPLKPITAEEIVGMFVQGTSPNELYIDAKFADAVRYLAGKVPTLFALDTE